MKFSRSDFEMQRFESSRPSEYAMGYSRRMWVATRNDSLH